MVGLSVLHNKLDLVANVLVLVSFVISWTWCSPYFGLSVLRNKLVLVGFPALLSELSGMMRMSFASVVQDQVFI